MEFPLRSASGNYRWFLTRVNPVKDDQGKVIKWFGTNTDINNKWELVESLEIAKNEAEKANQLKSSFLANMSHEIRTPLGAVLGFTDLLKEPGISDEESRNYLEIITRNGSHLNEIINDILDLSKVESNQLNVEKISANIEQLLAEIGSTFRTRAKEKRHHARYSFEHKTRSKTSYRSNSF